MPHLADRANLYKCLFLIRYLLTDVGEKNINNIVAEWYEDKENVDKMQNRKISFRITHEGDE